MEETLKDLADFELNMDAVYIGAQGPDIFFFHRSIPVIMNGKSQKKAGTAMHHTKPEKIFEAFRDYLKVSMNKDIAKSYIYGFLLHYSLDRCCHPFVYSIQEKMVQKNERMHPSTAHNTIEMAMDTYMLNKHLGYDNPFDFNGSDCLTNDIATLDEISNLMAFVMPRVTEYSLSDMDGEQAILDTKRVQNGFCHVSQILKPFIVVMETILAPMIGYFKISSFIKPRDLEKAKKYVNINNMTWVSPYEPEKPRTESFDELFESTKQDARLLVKCFELHCAGEATGYECTSNISFLTGTEVK